MAFFRWGRNSALKRQNSRLLPAVLNILRVLLLLASVSSSMVLAQNATSTPNPFIDVKGQIVFRQNDVLSSITLDGTSVQALSLDTGFVTMCPVWSHDGKQIATIGGSSEFGLYVFDATGGTPRAVLKEDQITDPPTGVPAWSQNNQTLAYTGQSGTLYLVNVADGTLQSTLNTLTFLSVDWSPDAKQFISFGVSPDGVTGIFTLNVDGTNLQTLVSLSQDDLSFAETSDHFFARDTALPHWSPDGSQIAYSAVSNDISSIYTIPATGGSPQAITNPAISAYAPAWSPDAKYLAYTAEVGSERTINVIDLSQTTRFGAITDLRIGGCPIWKPTP
jgi:Tol biopolymer transport system component